MRSIPEQDKLINAGLAGSAMAGAVVGTVIISGLDISTGLMIASIIACGILGVLAGFIGMAVYFAITGNQPFEGGPK